MSETPAPTETPRTRTHVPGLDFILGGGLPTGRVTLVAGGAGCGKSVLAAQYLAAGAEEGEPGILVSFEQRVDQLHGDLAGFDFDLPGLVDRDLLRIIAVDPMDVPGTATGPFTLDGILLQIESLAEEIGARRIALDTLESVLSQLGDDFSLRRELRRLCHWLIEREFTSVVTAEAGRGEEFTRRGLEEYVSDCVILLDHRIRNERSTRRARVVKFRGGDHSADEHPFLIGDQGLELIPVTAARLEHPAPDERVSSGVPSLDAMLGGGGFRRGESVLVSGSPGSGKSSLAAAFVDGACRRGEQALYLAFEESPNQIVRNMRSVGYDLVPWLDQGLLHIESRRPSQRGLEGHLFGLHRELARRSVDAVVLDPLTSLTVIRERWPSRSMLVRLVDHLKAEGVTALYTSLEGPGFAGEDPAATTVSSLMDTWLVLQAIRRDGARRRYGWVLKSRGSSHSPRRHRLDVTPEGLVFSHTDASDGTEEFG